MKKEYIIPKVVVANIPIMNILLFSSEGNGIQLSKDAENFDDEECDNWFETIE